MILAPSGITTAALSIRHQSDHSAISHPLTDAVEQALVMDSIEELGQMEIHDRLVAGFEVLLCLGDACHRTAPRPEAVLL